jgi:aspartate aminotransferase
MRYPLPERLRSIQPSVTLGLSARVKAMAKEGLDVVSFTAGEPEVPPPAFVLDAMANLDLAQSTRYTDTRGQPEARARAAAWMARECGATYGADDVLLLDGAKRALSLGILAAFDVGDQVIVSSPCWVSYAPMMALARVKPVLVPARIEDGFRPDFDALEAAVTPNTRGIIVNSPQNPTGVVYSEAELDGLAEFVRRHDLLLITDEVYHHLQFNDPPSPMILKRHPDLIDRTLVVNSMSKTYAVPGWRVGFAAGPHWWVRRMADVWGHTGSNLNALMQSLLVKVLEAPTDFVRERAATYARRRDVVVPRLRALPGVRVHSPEGAFYVFPEVKGLLGSHYRGVTLTTTVQFSEALLEGERLAVVPGDAFDGAGFLRLSLALPDAALLEGLARLDRFVQELT